MGLKDWFGKRIAVTTPGDPDPFFRPRRYDKSREEVVKAALSVVASLPDWRLEEHREVQGKLRVSSGSLFPPSAQDIHIYIVRGQDGIVKLEMTSQSLGGGAAWGRNESNLKRFLVALDKVLPPLGEGPSGQGPTP